VADLQCSVLAKR